MDKLIGGLIDIFTFTGFSVFVGAMVLFLAFVLVVLFAKLNEWEEGLGDPEVDIPTEAADPAPSELHHGGRGLPDGGSARPSVPETQDQGGEGSNAGSLAVVGKPSPAALAQATGRRPRRVFIGDPSGVLVMESCGMLD